MPNGNTHVVASHANADGEVWVAVEVVGTGYYLDKNICEQLGDGSGDWTSQSSGLTDRTLESLRAHTTADPVQLTEAACPPGIEWG